jgi:predicted chitinase
MSWETFFEDLKRAALGEPEKKAEPMPGKIMLCFMNRYLQPVDNLKYKFIVDGEIYAGTTTTASYCFNIQAKTLKPIRILVWSRKTKAFKALDPVTPIMGKAQLVRKIMATAKVGGRTAKHPEAPVAPPKPPTRPPAPPPGPPPTTNQGVRPTPATNEQGASQTQVQRPIPNMVTLAQLRQIFTDSRQATDAYLSSVAAEVNTDLVKYKLDTPLRRAHFFAQIKGEVGQGMKPGRENWNYSRNALLSFSSYYRNHPDEATQDAYLKVNGRIVRPADQDAIGRKHFLKLNGNRRLTHPEDGSNFRGRGLLQITGYEKYSSFMAEYNNFWAGAAPDTVTDPELICRFPYSVRSAIWFWVKYDVYSRADAGATPEHVRRVTVRVNGGEMHLAERRAAFVIARRAFT